MDSVGISNYHTSLSQANSNFNAGILLMKKELIMMNTISESTIKVIEDSSDIGKGLNIKL